jgi:predicted permease
MGQLALSLALIFASGLFFRGAVSARRVSAGFDRNGVLVAEFDHGLTRRSFGEGLNSSFAALEQARGLPGVRKAALTSLVPFSGVSTDLGASAPDGAKDEKGAPRSFSCTFAAVSAEYFEALGVRLLAGRFFAEAEARDPQATGVVIIDENLAHNLYGDASALGRRLRLGQTEVDGRAIEPEIVGVVANFRNDIFAEDNRGRLFLPFARGTSPVFKSALFGTTAYLHVRLDRGDRDSALAASQNLQAALRRMDAEFPLLSVSPLEDAVARDLGFWIARLGAILFGVCGGIALLLALIGVYGVKAYLVSRRSREIGIRMAIGATKSDIVRMVMRQGSVHLAIGICIGLLLALAVGRILAMALYRVSPTDPISLGVAVISLILASCLATWLPALRAARVNPTEALRSD